MEINNTFSTNENSDSSKCPFMQQVTVQGVEKTFYFMRHGQSEYNAAKLNGLPDPLSWDAPLTSKGIQQAIDVRKTVELLPPLDLIIVSPLRRAIHTMLLAFNDRLHSTPVIVRTEVRERVTGGDDLGRNPEELERDFPTLDFSHLKKIWWYTGDETVQDTDPYECRRRFGQKRFKEPKHIFLPRVKELIAMLAARPEKVIAVVGHATMFKQLIGYRLDNCEIHPAKLSTYDQQLYPFRAQNIKYAGRLIHIEMVDYGSRIYVQITDLETQNIEQITEPDWRAIDEQQKRDNESIELFKKSQLIARSINAVVDKYRSYLRSRLEFKGDLSEVIQYDMYHKCFDVIFPSKL